MYVRTYYVPSSPHNVRGKCLITGLISTVGLDSTTYVYCTELIEKWSIFCPRQMYIRRGSSPHQYT